MPRLAVQFDDNIYLGLLLFGVHPLWEGMSKHLICRREKCALSVIFLFFFSLRLRASNRHTHTRTLLPPLSNTKKKTSNDRDFWSYDAGICCASLLLQFSGETRKLRVPLHTLTLPLFPPLPPSVPLAAPPPSILPHPLS